MVWTPTQIAVTVAVTVVGVTLFGALVGFVRRRLSNNELS